MSETILHRLLQQDIIYDETRKEDEEEIYLFTHGVPVDYFIMILQGRVEVTIGKENLVFEQGPFSYFGQQALVAPSGNSLFFLVVMIWFFFYWILLFFFKQNI